MNKHIVLRRNSRTIYTITTLLFVFVFNHDLGAIGPLYWAAVLSCCGLLLCLSGGFKRIRVNLFLLWYLSFVLLSGASCVWAIEPSNVIAVLKSMVINLFIVISIDLSVRNAEDSFALMRAVLMASVLTALYLIAKIDWGTIGMDRIGIEGDSQRWNLNDIGLMGMWSLAFYLILPKKGGIFAHVFYMAPNLAVLLLSGSRKAWLALVLIVILHLFVHNRGELLKKIFFSLCIFGAAAYLVMNVPILYEIGGRRFEVLLDAILGNGAADSGTIMRLRYIELGWEAFLKRPFFGYGLDCYRKLLSASYISRDTYSHHNYIELLVNGGMVTTLVFYSIYAMAFFRGFRWLKRNRGKAVPGHRRLVLYFMGLLVLQLGLQMGMVMYQDLSMLIVIMLYEKLLRIRFGGEYVVKKNHSGTAPKRHL